MNDHTPTSTYYPGSDREPWQIAYQCSCGADLGCDEQGRGGMDREAAWDAHLAEVSTTP